MCVVAKERGDGDGIPGGAPGDAPAGSDSPAGVPWTASDDEFFGLDGGEDASGVPLEETSGSGDDPADVDAIGILDDDIFAEGGADSKAPKEDVVGLAEPTAPVVGGSITAASSSGPREPPPLPPPIAPPPAPFAAGEEPDRAQQLWVRGGKLSYYTQKKFMTAICENKAHGKCVLTRTIHGREGFPDGRPLGLMVAWLAKGCDLDTKRDHWRSIHWPTFAERCAARDEFAMLTHPDAVGMRQGERKQRGDEGPEPYLCAPPRSG